MPEIITVGLDLAKNVFQVHGADEAGQSVVRKKLWRGQVLDFSASCRRVLPRWKPVAVRTSRAVRSASWVKRCD